MPNSMDRLAMDSKPASWFRDLYEEFENLLSEVEEDAFKFVENKVQAAGASVKKFYSEVMQDLNPQSYADSAEIAHGESSSLAQNVVEKKGKSKLADNTQVIKGENSCGERQSLRIRGNSSNNRSISRTLAPLSAESSRMSSVCKNSEGCSVSSDHMDRHKQDDSKFSLKETTAEIRDHVPITDVSVSSSLTDAAASGEISLIGSSGVLVENCDSDVTEQEVKIVELVDGQRPEETCVLVEEDKLCFPQKPVKNKSYKKRFLEAFSSRNRSSRVYDNLEAQNEEAEQSVVEKSNTKLSVSSDFLDSEWELI